MAKTTQATTCTVIQFSRLVDRPAQQIYQLVRNGSLPAELIRYVPKGSGGKQPTLLVDDTLAWWNQRQEKCQQGQVKVLANAEQVIERMQDMLSTSEDPEVQKLAKALAEVMKGLTK